MKFHFNDLLVYDVRSSNTYERTNGRTDEPKSLLEKKTIRYAAVVP